MNNLLKENEVVHCPTFKVAEEVLQHMHADGKIISDRTFAWHTFGADTCYSNSMYSPIAFYLDKGATILSAPEFLARQEPAFVLPERWAVKRTPDSYKVINEWANEQAYTTGGFLDSDGFICGGEKLQRPIYMPEKYDPRFTEITFEQFKEHVLGEKKGGLLEINSDEEGLQKVEESYKKTMDTLEKTKEKFNDFYKLPDENKELDQSGHPEFNWGEAVEVKDKSSNAWRPAKYIGLHPINEQYKYIVSLDESGGVSQWSMCRRPIPLKTFTPEEATAELQKLFPDQKVEIIF